MVKIKCPVTLIELEGTLGVLFRYFAARGSKREFLDTEKMITIDLKKGESIVLMDRNDDFWELSRNGKGQHHLKRLNGALNLTLERSANRKKDCA
jgi:hypothetical protein